MADIRCVVCGEPWEAYGIRSSMAAWEYDLFNKGAGCPACEGQRSEGFEMEKFSDFDNGDEDPMKRIVAYENAQAGNVPEWKIPTDEVIHECDGCDVQLVRLLSEEHYNGSTLIKEYGWKNIPYQWYQSHPFSRILAEDYVSEDWKPWGPANFSACPFCAIDCEQCGDVKVGIGNFKFEDVYNPGYSFENDVGARCICVDCYEQNCAEEDDEAAGT